MAALQSHTSEAAYATSVDSQGRTNIVVPFEVPAAEVTAMTVRAQNDTNGLHAITGATHTITKAKK